MDPAYPKNSTILVVDDTATNLKVLLRFLKKFGFELTIAQNSQEMFNRLDHQIPDLILLDVMMPGLDGFEACRRLKATERTHDIPVIFLTVLPDLESKIKGFEVGGVDFITKPIEPHELRARVVTHLSLRHLQRELQAKNEQLQAQNSQLQVKNQQLQTALAKVKTLSGLLPICANCKQIRDDQGYWHQVEVYIRNHSEAEFSHGLCPECIKTLYPDFDWTEGDQS
jgi:PleD family two-component response regulator